MRAMLGLAVLTAVVAIGGAYATTRPSAPTAAAVPTATPSPSPAGTIVDPDDVGPFRFDGLGRGRPGPDGTGWRWMTRRGGFSVRTAGQRWIAFNAYAASRPRRLVVTAPDGAIRRVSVPTEPTEVLLGPYERGAYSMRADPQGARNSANTLRFSEPQALPQPVAALPSSGFYGPERDGSDQPFRWMANRAALKIVSGVADSAKLSLTVAPIDRSRRRLLVEAGGFRRSFAFSGERRRITIPSLDIGSGTTTVRLRATPRAPFHQPDDRVLSFAVSEIGVRLADASGTPTP